MQDWSPEVVDEDEEAVNALRTQFTRETLDQRIEEALPFLAKRIHEGDVEQTQEHGMKELDEFKEWADDVVSEEHLDEWDLDAAEKGGKEYAEKARKRQGEKGPQDKNKKVSEETITYEPGKRGSDGYVYGVYSNFNREKDGDKDIPIKKFGNKFLAQAEAERMEVPANVYKGRYTVRRTGEKAVPVNELKDIDSGDDCKNPKRDPMLEEVHPDEEIFDGDMVYIKSDSPYYDPRETGPFMASQCDPEKGKCWIGDSDDRGWYIAMSELEPTDDQFHMSSDDEDDWDDEYNEDINDLRSLSGMEESQPKQGSKSIKQASDRSHKARQSSIAKAKKYIARGGSKQEALYKYGLEASDLEEAVVKTKPGEYVDQDGGEFKFIDDETGELFKDDPANDTGPSELEPMGYDDEEDFGMISKPDVDNMDQDIRTTDYDGDPVDSLTAKGYSIDDLHRWAQSEGFDDINDYFGIEEGNDMRESYEDSPKGSRVTTNLNPLIREFSDGSLTGHLNLATFMNIHGISAEYQQDLANAVLQSGVRKKVNVPGHMTVDYEKGYRDEGKPAPKLSIALSKWHEKDMNKGPATKEDIDQHLGSLMEDYQSGASKEDIIEKLQYLKKLIAQGLDPETERYAREKLGELMRALKSSDGQQAQPSRRQDQWVGEELDSIVKLSGIK
jgi:hypothetical protein